MSWLHSSDTTTGTTTNDTKTDKTQNLETEIIANWTESRDEKKREEKWTGRDEVGKKVMMILSRDFFVLKVAWLVGWLVVVIEEVANQ